MVNKYSQPTNIADRSMATIYAIARDNANIEIVLKEYWNYGYQTYIVLTNEQAKELANDIYQIIKDGE
jgi:hypothetical protein